VYAETGSAETGRHCGIGNVSKPTLGSRLTHYERNSANGEWEFSKEVSYESGVRP